ncbi:MAG: Na+/alanine symporter [Desulforhopalus sp.]|jgi:Na+/alanine symporter
MDVVTTVTFHEKIWKIDITLPNIAFYVLCYNLSRIGNIDFLDLIAWFILNLSEVPAVFSLIFRSAFGAAAFGTIVGVAIHGA